MEEDLEFLNHEIEECIKNLTDTAKQHGDNYNKLMVSMNRPVAPNAWRASHLWKAVCIIRQLQSEIEELKLKKK